MEPLERCWLQAQLHTGNFRIATLIRQTVYCVHGRSHVVAFGEKQPVAIIIASKTNHDIIGLTEEALPFIKAQGLDAAIADYLAQLAFEERVRADT